MMTYAKPNQKFAFVRYNREFAITVIVITKFDYLLKLSNFEKSSLYRVTTTVCIHLTDNICGPPSIGSSFTKIYLFKFQVLMTTTQFRE